MKFKLERPILATDVVLFCIHEQKLRFLTCRRDKEPFIGAPALPGVAILPDETLICAARRALKEKALTPNENIYLEQLAAFDALYRDPRGRTVSVAYVGITRQIPQDSANIIWQTAGDFLKTELPFDHGEIVRTAVERLRGKLRYTNIAKAFLPQNFRIEEIQAVYEAILNFELNRDNFRSKLLKIKMIERVSILSEVVGRKGGRPPHLYRFSSDTLKMQERDFL